MAPFQNRLGAPLTRAFYYPSKAYQSVETRVIDIEDVDPTIILGFSSINQKHDDSRCVDSVSECWVRSYLMGGVVDGHGLAVGEFRKKALFGMERVQAKIGRLALNGSTCQRPPFHTSREALIVTISAISFPSRHYTL